MKGLHVFNLASGAFSGMKNAKHLLFVVGFKELQDIVIWVP